MNSIAEVEPSGASIARHLILGTAGHIDHGKTSLVRALTGTDTDRLPEEQRRGMTIELGFAELPIDGVHFGIVDVPGHERFVRTMVAGATGIDMALIVVAGDDSVMPQTVEHVEVLKLMGIEHAVVAVTKSDLVDETLLELVETDVAELLNGTPLADASIVRVCSNTGFGLDKLKAALAETAARVRRRESTTPFRMAIDRVFTVQGRGTVVTGSVLRGVVSPGDTLEILPKQLSCRVRQIQSHGQSQDSVHNGQRAALNLSGVDRANVQRGDELVTAGYIQPARRADAAFEVVSTCRSALKPFSRVRLCMGTRELPARVVPLNRESISPGARDYVQLRSREPILASWGQRFIARSENDARTIGGGIIIRPTGRRWSSSLEDERSALQKLETGSNSERLTRIITECGFSSSTPMQLAARTGIEPDDLTVLLETLAQDSPWVSLDGTTRRVMPAVVETLFDRADRWLTRYHKTHPDEPGCPVDAFVGWMDRKSAAGLGRPLLDHYVSLKRAGVRGRFVCLPEFTPTLSVADEKLMSELLNSLEDGDFQPPTLEQLSNDLGVDLKRLRRLTKIAVSFDELAEIDGSIYLPTDREHRLREIIAELIQSNEGITVSQARERLRSSRKYVVPFMEYLDRIRFTKRRGDVRVLHEGATP